ncbi:RNA binding (RRM/RBD/RNP motifs) family protein [Actinidia rufa]|uniref:RNA binding (RRM/RBD/RNP motifs) family protein n=1 Tax=Actinidia rufa TaxID=165716 RepID=A0A7J0GQX2_9ERIC|nr:RNA binding (RRM/RBD/RNP motifs) family protein [Actinidia rufa]
MDMAEKDETEGRCPACRTPYNKAKVVGMAANCERLVAEMNMEKKVKLQKAKSKGSESRKHLSSVRVIQRNLVYIVGLPLNLADEDLLQRSEYFGQYGKVLKVSISRTAAGSIQHFANNTCSVACFGTTKYCHAWLRNMPCSNPDCLYLHEIGSQEDSFTKDEIISAYTRSRVEQITGATNNMQRRSGDVLPPPADEYHINGSASSGKTSSKSASSNPACSIRGSLPNSSSGRSVALPAATSWGVRGSNYPPPSASLVCSNGPSKQKPETCSGSMAFSTAVAGLDSRTTASATPATLGLPATSTGNGQLQTPPASKDNNRYFSTPPNTINSFDLPGRSYGHGPNKDLNAFANGTIMNLCSDMSSINIDKHHPGGEHSGDIRPNTSLCDNTLVNSSQNQWLQESNAEQVRAPPKSHAVGKAVASTGDICVTREQSDQMSNSVTREQSDWRLDSQTQVANTDSQVAFPEVEEDLRHFEDQRLKDPEVVTHSSYFTNSSPSFHLSNNSKVYCPQQNEPNGSPSYNLDPQILNKKDKGLLLLPSCVPTVTSGYPEDIISSFFESERTVDNSYLLPVDVQKKQAGRCEGEAANADQNSPTDIRESSIISNMLSVDFDAWDESLTSPQNFSKLLGETDRRQASLTLSSSRKAQNNSQSRFSFARQEESRNQVSDVEPSFSYIGQVLKDRPLSHDFPESRDFSFNMLGNCNGFSTFNIEESDNFGSSHSHMSSNKLSVSRAQVSAPPGFSIPSRAPPPGFSSHERMEPTLDAMSGNHMLDPSTLFRNPYQAPPYQAPPTGNIGSIGDIEFMDPAILAVGKGRLPGGLNNAASLDMRSNFPSQLSAFENEARLQMLMQRSLSPLQNQRFADMADGFSPLSDAYRIPSRVMEQTLTNNLSPFSQLSLRQSRTAPMPNGQWNGWNEVQSGSDLGMTELLRTEILGGNKLYNGYEDSKFRMPSSGDLYNRTYGI